MMNCSRRIQKLERIVSFLPTISRENIESIIRFLETGKETVLPMPGVYKAEVLRVICSIPDENRDLYPGLTLIEDALLASDRILDAHEKVGLKILPFIKGLDPNEQPWAICFWTGDYGGQDQEGIEDSITPGENLLIKLGLLELLYVGSPDELTFQEDENEQKRTIL